MRRKTTRTGMRGRKTTGKRVGRMKNIQGNEKNKK